jgi:hypothetical protein
VRRPWKGPLDLALCAWLHTSSPRPSSAFPPALKRGWRARGARIQPIVRRYRIHLTWSRPPHRGGVRMLTRGGRWMLPADGVVLNAPLAYPIPQGTRPKNVVVGTLLS